MNKLRLKIQAVRIFNMADTVEAQMNILESELPSNTWEFDVVKQLIVYLQTPRNSDEIESYLTSLLD